MVFMVHLFVESNLQSMVKYVTMTGNLTLPDGRIERQSMGGREKEKHMDEEKPSLRYKSCQESYLNLFTLLYHNILELYCSSHWYLFLA